MKMQTYVLKVASFLRIHKTECTYTACQYQHSVYLVNAICGVQRQLNDKEQFRDETIFTKCQTLRRQRLAANLLHI